MGCIVNRTFIFCEFIMKIGDLVKVKEEHWSNRGEVGIIIEEIYKDGKNKGKAWRILFPGGKLRPKLTKHMDILNESR